MATPIITDGSTDRVQHAPRVVLPIRPTVFSDRAARLEALANEHPMADYLRLMAAIGHAQQAALSARRAPEVDTTALAASRDYGMPPLSAQSHQRSAQWRDDLSDIAETVRAGATGRVLSIVAQLPGRDAMALEALADRVLAGATTDDDAADVPFIGAALQVYFTRLASTLAADDVQQCDVPGICPVCASRPVSSIVRLGGEQNNLRYLVCSLCSTEWNMARIQCTSCQQEKGVHYLAVTASDAPADAKQASGEGSSSSTRAEACDECKSYLKIVYQEKDPFADPHADDLATLALDVLVDEQGFARSGPNLLFHPGGS